MSTTGSNRLERALALFLAHQQNGGDWRDLLQRHADLADLLESFVATDAAPMADAAAPLPNAAFGDFELGAAIGRGGAGTVYEAQQRSLGRRVALKLLHPESCKSPTALARFHRESQALARLDHPGIVRILALGADDGRPWLAMEFVDGTSLAARLDQLRGTGGHAGDSLRRLVQTVADVARALDHAHRAGLVHRDVKPSNILLRVDGSAVLGDFGLVHDPDGPSLTQTGLIAGTPRYMAPEQVLGRDAGCDARTDVFALGATLYECITLQPAFVGDSTAAVLGAVLRNDFVDPRRHRRDLPLDLVAICQKALEPAPADRYPTAQAMADDLVAFLDLRPVAAARPNRVRRLWRRLRRQPLLLVTAVLIALVLGLGGSLVWQWPALHDAAVAAAERRYEDSLVEGLLARAESRREACFPALERALQMHPDRGESIAAMALAHLHFNGASAALAVLDQHAAVQDEITQRCRALLLVRLGRHDAAAELERTLGPPTTAMGLWLSAVVRPSDHRNPEQVREAARLLSLATRIAPRPHLLLHMQWGATVYELGDPVAAREAADALEQLWPEHPLALYVAGLDATCFDAARAVRLLQRSIASGYADPQAHYLLGVAQLRSGDRSGAETTLAGLLRRPDVSDTLRFHAAAGLHDAGAAELEQQFVDAWLAREPRSLGARRLLARRLSRAGDHVPAIALLKACATDAPNDLELREDLAFALLSGNDPAGAMALLTEVVPQMPDKRMTHLLVLDAADALGDVEAGLAELRRWAERRPADPLAWQELAEALLRTGEAARVAEALTAAERADVAAEGGSAEVLMTLVEVLEKAGYREEAARRRARGVLPAGK